MDGLRCPNCAAPIKDSQFKGYCFDCWCNGCYWRDQIAKAIELAVKSGQVDGAHHKAWVIDQMVRILADDEYEKIVTEAKAGEDGPETYSWDTGIPP